MSAQYKGIVHGNMMIAAAQFPVSASIARNVKWILKQMREAAQQHATVVHFPETALSGYPPRHGVTPTPELWEALEYHARQICAEAKTLGLWVVLGALDAVEGDLPASAVKVISDQGQIVATYAKQRLYGREKACFSAGDSPAMVEINGHLCGFLICYDNCFPELYRPYREASVQVLFHSFFNAQNSHATSIRALMQANLLVRAADNQMWISASNSCRPYCPLPASIVRPDGSHVAARRHVSAIVYDTFPDDDLGWTYDNRTV